MTSLETTLYLILLLALHTVGKYFVYTWYF